jgi:hypothetical protein
MKVLGFFELRAISQGSDQHLYKPLAKTSFRFSLLENGNQKLLSENSFLEKQFRKTISGKLKSENRFLGKVLTGKKFLKRKALTSTFTTSYAGKGQN